MFEILTIPQAFTIPSILHPQLQDSCRGHSNKLTCRKEVFQNYVLDCWTRSCPCLRDIVQCLPFAISVHPLLSPRLLLGFRTTVLCSSNCIQTLFWLLTIDVTCIGMRSRLYLDSSFRRIPYRHFWTSCEMTRNPRWCVTKLPKLLGALLLLKCCPI